MILNVKSFQHALSDHIAFEPSPDPGKLLSINAMSHLNHLIGQTHQTHSSHLTQVSQQGPVMIEDQL